MTTEVSKRLRTIRKGRRWSRAQLAQACGPRVTERTIGRIESGVTQNPRQGTVTLLARHLQVEVGELTGDLPLPEFIQYGPRPMEVGDTFPVGGKFRPELRLAFDLIRHRYGWDEQRVIGLAPLLFVLLVERCIGWHRQRLADLNEQLERWDRQIVNQEALKEIPTGEEEPLPEQFHRTFGEYLCTLAADISAGAAKPMVTELWSGPQGRICETYLDRVTGGSHLARWALEYGDVRLDDIPRELRSPTAQRERRQWLESRLSDEAKAMLRERSARGLRVGPRSLEAWRSFDGQDLEMSKSDR